MTIDEEGTTRRELDRDDRLRILTELRKHPHPLTHQSESLYNIVDGQVVSETKVNVQDAMEIGQDTSTSFASSLPGGFHHPIKKTVETMQVPKRGVKIKGKTVYDLETVFVPPSLIDQYGCIRKRNKAVRKGLLGIHSLSGSHTVSNPNGRGKVPALHVLTQTNINSLDSVLWEGSATRRDLRSQRVLLLSVPKLSERKHLVECYQA